MLNKSEIIGGTLSIIAVIALISGIYNIVIYQNVSNSLATGALVNIADNTTATKTADTSTGITTAAITSTGTTTAAITTTPVSTDDITTNPPEECQRTLPFGSSAGDDLNRLDVTYICFNSCVIWGETLEQPIINTPLDEGFITINKDFLHLKISAIGTALNMEEWSIFSRVVSSDKEKKAIACLVNNSNTVEAHVFTWRKINTMENEEEQVIQIILASLGQSTTYIIRIYSDSLPTIDDTELVSITYSNIGIFDERFTQLTLDDVRGKRQIFDISPAVKKNETLTVVEEGNNCTIFC